MDIEWWQKVQQYFEHVVDMSPSDRKQFLSLVCVDDDTMLAEINTLLNAADEAQQQAFMDEPAEFQMFAPGDQINHYQIRELLGKGAMGEVYLAESQVTGDVAIKCLPIMLNHDETALKRFQHSAGLAMKLQHPGICQIFEIGETDANVHYLVMQYCSGGDLEEHMPSLKPDLNDTLAVIKNLLLGLKEAHQASIWHRDIKPANIMFTTDGMVKIVDFGIAKDPTTKLTVTGTQLGTPAYMAPEQWSGKDIDHRVDLWALGVILYELVTGNKPFQGFTFVDMMHSICHETHEPVVSSDYQVPVGLQEIIDIALQKDKTARFKDADAFLDAINGL